MSDDTILGSPPGGSAPVPDGVVPGEGPVDDAGRDASADDAADAVQVDRDVPGDVDTAVHRSRIYSLLALGFDRPGDEFDRAVEAGGFCSDLVASARALDDDLAKRALAVGTHVDHAAALHGAWASLFGVEEGVTVSPHELTYLPGPLTTNVRRLADVSGFYEAFDLEVVPGSRGRRDHLCFQLEFLGRLCEREAYLGSVGDAEGVAVVVDARRQFVEAHLGRWYWRFTDEVSQRDDGFYAALADLLAALLEYEIDALEVDPDWVPDDPEVAEWTEDVFGESGRGCGGCGADPQGVDPGVAGVDGPPTATDLETDRLRDGGSPDDP